MIAAPDFVDFYELLELSPNATPDTIDRVFRYQAKRFHPDSGCTDDSAQQQFTQLVEAYETLRDPNLRAEYDVLWEQRKDANLEVVQGANEADNDCQQRSMILQIFYGQRRRDMRNPGVSTGRIEEITSCPADLLSFHLWYFREKGWIDREESGLMSITADGVDHLESICRSSENMKRIEYKSATEENDYLELTRRR